jgi:hypothetical protein
MAPLRIALWVAAGLALAGCTSQGTPTAESSTSQPSVTTATGESSSPPSSPPSSAAGPARCTAAVLSGTVQQSDSAAGNRYAHLVVTNTGSATCTLYGYGGLQLLDENDQPLPTSGARDEKPGPSLVTVQPGGTARKLLHWTVVATGNEPVDQPCQPPAAKLSIIPPDETEPFVVAWELGPVCNAGTFHDGAYQAP